LAYFQILCHHAEIFGYILPCVVFLSFNLKQEIEVKFYLPHFTDTCKFVKIFGRKFTLLNYTGSESNGANIC